MESEIPAISSVVWASFMTGTNPGEHGIFGFTDRKPGKHDISFPNYSNLSAGSFGIARAGWGNAAAFVTCHPLFLQHECQMTFADDNPQTVMDHMPEKTRANCLDWGPYIGNRADLVAVPVRDYDHNGSVASKSWTGHSHLEEMHTHDDAFVYLRSEWAGSAPENIGSYRRCSWS